jgi:hypothetical protein
MLSKILKFRSQVKALETIKVDKMMTLLPRTSQAADILEMTNILSLLQIAITEVNTTITI